jgi:hypothetical protein
MAISPISKLLAKKGGTSVVKGKFAKVGET